MIKSDKIVLLHLIYLQFFVPPHKVATNQHYSLAINDYGDLYSWGNNESSKLGYRIDEETGEIINQPKKYEYFFKNNQKILEVACGDNHIATVVINKSENGEAGDVYTWGLSLFGRLGYLEGDEDNNNKKNQTKKTYEYKLTPHLVRIPEKISRIACGFDFIILTKLFIT